VSPLPSRPSSMAPVLMPCPCVSPTACSIAADSRLAGGTGGDPARRLIAITAMFTGAPFGALLVTTIDLVLPLAIAAALIAASALAAARSDVRPRLSS
jgi:hypothetical protein